VEGNFWSARAAYRLWNMVAEDPPPGAAPEMAKLQAVPPLVGDTQPKRGNKVVGMLD